MSFDVRGKTAIVTGAGSGINLAFAAVLLSHGCNVVIADLALRPEAEHLVASQHDNAGVVFVKTDVTKWNELEHMFDKADEVFGGFDIVCPGAGVFEPHWSNFWHPPGSRESKDLSNASRYALFDINLTHPIRTTQIAIARWLNTPNRAIDQSKRIVHISSIAGQLPSFSAPMYAASKAAISNFVRSLARLDELGIRVIAVAPGVIKTPLWTDHPEKMIMLDVQDEWVEPQEVALAMLRCCEDESFVGGSIVEVLKGHTRLVQSINDPGPSQKSGATASNTAVSQQQVFDWLKEPGWGV